jgi:signal transduction histidine kinase
MRKQPRILIVEDETITTFHLRRSLTRLGYEVVGVAASGTSALEQVEQASPDLLLADIGLEGEVDGVEVAIRAREQYGIPTVFLTAYSDSETMRRARISEPYGFLIKPFAEHELQATIEIALQQNALRAAQEQEITANSKVLLRTQEELNAVTARLFRIQEQEREEIARELHDDLGQRLSVLQITLENLWAQIPGTVRNAIDSDVQKAYRLLDELSDDLRNVAHRLHPSILDHLGLPMALRELAETFQDRYSIPVRISLRRVPDKVSPQIALALYRIVQEALHNIAKHAGRDATVTIALIGSATALHLTVRDTGQGMEPKPLESVKGIGLISMAQRAKMVGGKMTIDSHPGQGTRIYMSIPLIPEGDAEKQADSVRATEHIVSRGNSKDKGAPSAE